MPYLFAFFDELRKLGASKGQLAFSKSRSGRRPISVENFLKKEKDGGLYKKLGSAVGVEFEDGNQHVLTGPEAEQKLTDIQASLGHITDPFLSGLRNLFEPAPLLHGGLAERSDKSPTDFDPFELEKGTEEEEKEHTNDEPTARQIAMDHLTEHPRYYAALEQMEKGLDDQEKKAWAKLAVSKFADSWKPQWLELASTPNDHFMDQSQGAQARSRPGDAPEEQEGLVEGKLPPKPLRAGRLRYGDAPTDADLMTQGQNPRVNAQYGYPENTLAPKEAAAWAKLAGGSPTRPATMGPQVKSPTDTCPDVNLGPPGRIQHQLDKNYFVGSSSDAQPLTGTSNDAYQRT